MTVQPAAVAPTNAAADAPTNAADTAAAAEPAKSVAEAPNTATADAVEPDAPADAPPPADAAPPGDMPAVTPGPWDVEQQPVAEPAPAIPTGRAARRRTRRRRRVLAATLVGAVVVAATAVGGTIAAMAKTVTISVDGATHQVTTLSGTVDGALAAAGVDVGRHDTLAPAGGIPISDGSRIVVQRGRQLSVTIDGTTRTFWTTASTVGAAMAQLGRDPADFQLSADRSREIPLSGLRLTANSLHTVTLSDGDGDAMQLTTAARTVGDLLHQQGISTSADRRVSPSQDTLLTDGLTITVRHLPAVTVVTGSHRETVVTGAETVGDVLAAQGIPVTDATRVSPSADSPVSNGLVISVSYLPAVTVRVGDDPAVTVITGKTTVGQLLAARNIALGDHDTVSPGAKTPLSEGLSVTVNRVRYATSTKTRTIPQPADRTVEDSSLAKGTQQITQQGHPGAVKITYRTKITNGEPGKAKEVARTTVTDAAPTIIHVGTYVAPVTTTSARPTTSAAPPPAASNGGNGSGAATGTKPSRSTQSPTTSAAKPPATSSAPSTKASPSPSSSIDLSRGPGLAVWEQIAQCESTNNWHINTGNGYYGGLQFDISTWLANGGGKYAPRADLATKAQQIDIANNTYASRGLSPWACARILGLI